MENLFFSFYLDEFVAKSAHPLKHPKADSVRYDSYPYGGHMENWLDVVLVNA